MSQDNRSSETIDRRQFLQGMGLLATRLGLDSLPSFPAGNPGPVITRESNYIRDLLVSGDRLVGLGENVRTSESSAPGGTNTNISTLHFLATGRFYQGRLEFRKVGAHFGNHVTPLMLSALESDSNYIAMAGYREVLVPQPVPRPEPTVVINSTLNSVALLASTRPESKWTNRLGIDNKTLKAMSGGSQTTFEDLVMVSKNGGENWTEFTNPQKHVVGFIALTPDGESVITGHIDGIDPSNGKKIYGHAELNSPDIALKDFDIALVDKPLLLTGLTKARAGYAGYGLYPSSATREDGTVGKLTFNTETGEVEVRDIFVKPSNPAAPLYINSILFREGDNLLLSASEPSHPEEQVLVDVNMNDPKKPVLIDLTRRPEGVGARYIDVATKDKEGNIFVSYMDALPISDRLYQIVYGMEAFTKDTAQNDRNHLLFSTPYRGGRVSSLTAFDNRLVAASLSEAYSFDLSQIDFNGNYRPTIDWREALLTFRTYAIRMPFLGRNRSVSGW